MQKYLLLLVLLFTITLRAVEHPSFETIREMPHSYAKDYYIWRFIQEKNTTKQEALTAYQWSKRKSPKLKKAIRAKTGHLPILNNTSKNTHKKEKDSKNFIIYPATAAKKSKHSLKKLYKRIKRQGKYSEVLEVLSSNKPFKTLATLKPKVQLYIYNGVGSKYRKKYFNHPFSKEQIQLFLKERAFNQTIFKTITTHQLQKTKKSLVFDSSNNKLKFESNFLLAMNAIEFKDINRALNFLSLSRTKTKRQSHYDQVDFWFYLLTKYDGFLEQLIRSNQVNLYTLSARDILKKPYPNVLTPLLEEKAINNFDIANPIDWENIKITMKKEPNNLNSLAEKYKSNHTLGIYSYIKEKASKYTVPYYPMPYPESMFGFTKERKALIYAIARQESRFVPASISTSYALGMMQIMPFLIKHLAKERGEKLDLNEMFQPEIAISYGNQHLDYLNSWLYHPLFVAYAYNGGIGFTKRTIKSSHLFKKGSYEPYLSMELIDYIQSRDYGKKVLSNYVMYLNILGIQTRVSDFLKMLEYPSQTDRFRK